MIKDYNYMPDHEYFCLGGKVYSVLFSCNQVKIKEFKLVDENKVTYEVHSWDVAVADSDSCLYRMLKKTGVKSIRYIKHFGGKFSRILVSAEDNLGIYTVTFEGVDSSCYYDFEVECLYNYAHAIDSESAKSKVDIQFLHNNNPETSVNKPTKDRISKSANNQEDNYVDFDLDHIFYMKQKDGGAASGIYNPKNNHFMAYKGLSFPVNVSGSFSRYQTRDLLISKYSRKNGIYYVTTRDFEFDSPSTAACIIKGYSTNGMIEWKTKDGICLRDLYGL